MIVCAGRVKIMKKDAVNATLIGAVCIISYIVSYYMRNVLSVLTPDMLETGRFTKSYIGMLSSSYFVSYAVGQLINGIAGDVLSPKKMIVTGLIIAGLSAMFFPFTNVHAVHFVCFVLLGFSLSMLRGPLMKVITENTSTDRARIICLFFSAAGFLGIFIASITAAIFEWNRAFVAAGIMAFFFALFAFFMLTYLEKKNCIKKFTKGERKKIDIAGIFKIKNFLFYLGIGMLIETVTSSINFWVPTYLTEELLFDKVTANMVFSVMSVIRAAVPFCAFFIFKLMHERDIMIIKYAYLVSAAFYLLMLLPLGRWINIGFFLLSGMFSQISASMMWSIYIPGLGKTGKVSGANGILDCAGYVGAALSNMVFSSLMGVISWNGIILLWAALMMVGCIAAFIKEKRPD